MRSQTLTEFAEDMRRKGDIRQSDLADEILMLVNIEEEVAEPYSTLCEDIENYAKDYSDPTDARRALEWLGDRSNLLADIEEELKGAGRLESAMLDPLDEIKDMLAKIERQGEALAECEAILEDLNREQKQPKEYDL